MLSPIAILFLQPQNGKPTSKYNVIMMAEPISDKIKQDLQAWLHLLGIEKDLEKNENYITAFTHPSYKGMFPKAEDYERYEFLGDSVLDLISAEELFFEQNFSEGVMTEKRKLLVNNEYLAQVYDRLKMAQFTRTAVNYVPSTKDRANYVEAFFGALFIEFGYKKCKAVWDLMQNKMKEMSNIGKMDIMGEMGMNKKKTIGKHLTAEEKQNETEMKQIHKQMGLIPKNAKSSLQELCQKLNFPIPEYTLVEQTGSDHEPFFKVKVAARVQLLSNETQSAMGEGRSKKAAEVKAAEALCDEIYLDYIPSH
ncbi:MAG: ribonuclease III family protein [Promethearchaeota archaeon]